MSREYLRTDGTPVDMANLVRGELLHVKLTIASDAERALSDLVVEDLFAGAFEPVHREIAQPGRADWVMRSDARDDRMLVFSKKFKLEANGKVEFYYPVRVVSAGDFILPGSRVEAMYAPTLRAQTPPTRIRIAN